ncbi:MAG: polysaccharide biosynthesis C-terminal domain-containing protein [Reichenbachiella sp.]|uniref:lipopolysaccharide biosynthesis protein n=1 Tax=Reichenbachiella sp. TaxID=2184521 RepID=UPI00329828DD
MKKILKKTSKLLSQKNLLKKVKSTAVIFSGKFVGIVCGLALNYIIATQYGTTAIGEYSLFLSFTNISSMLLLLGLNRSTLKNLPELKVKKLSPIPWLKGNLRLLLVSQFLFFIPVYLLILFNEDYFLRDHIEYFPIILIVAIFARTYKEFSLSSSRGFMKIWPYALGQGSMNVFVLCVLAIGLYLDNPIHPNKSIAIALLIDALVYGIYLILVVSHESKATPIDPNSQDKLALPKLKNILSESLPLYYTTLINFFTLQGGIYFLRYFHDLEEVSFYSMATRYAFIVNMIYMTVKGYTSPQLAKHKANGDIPALIDEAKKSTQLVLFVSIPLVLVLIISTPYLLLLHGEEFIKSYVPFLIITVGLVLKVFFGAGDNFLNMTGHNKDVKRINTISFILFVTLNLILNPLYSYNGAAIAFSSTIIVRHALCSLSIRRTYKYKIGYLSL